MYKNIKMKHANEQKRKKKRNERRSEGQLEHMASRHGHQHLVVMDGSPKFNLARTGSKGRKTPQPSQAH